MQNSTELKINELVEKLNALSAVYPEVSQVFQSARAAIATSAKRALSQEKKLSTRARMTVASAITPVLNYVIETDDFNHHTGRLVASMIELCRNLAEGNEIECREYENCEVPSGWKADSEGLLLPVSGMLGLSIAFRPHLPGGDWCLYDGAMPVCYGLLPSTLAAKAETLTRIKRTLTNPRVPGFFPMSGARRRPECPGTNSPVEREVALVRAR